MKNKIALDVDGVLLNWYLAMCIHFNQPYKQVQSWDIDWLHQKFSNIANDKSFWSNLPVLSHPKAITFDFTCYLTSLPKEMATARYNNLQKLGFPNKPIIVSETGKGTSKLELMIKHDFDILIDDKPSTCYEINDSKTGKKAIRFNPQYFWDEQVHLDVQSSTVSITHLSQINQLLNLEYV